MAKKICIKYTKKIKGINSQKNIRSKLSAMCIPVCILLSLTTTKSKIQKGCMKLPEKLWNKNFLTICTSLHCVVNTYQVQSFTKFCAVVYKKNKTSIDNRTDQNTPRNFVVWGIIIELGIIIGVKIRFLLDLPY